MRVEELYPTVTSNDTDHVPAKEDEKAMASLEKLAAFLNENH